MPLEPQSCYMISEVHNYGGFFGGDTITFEAAPLSDLSNEQTIVIDAKDFANVPERHNILGGMVLELHMAGERVDRARLLAAASHEELRTALGSPQLPTSLDAPLKLTARCPHCQRWVLAELLDGEQCAVCALQAN